MDEKKYVIISDFNLKSNNRGTAALGYGAISFLLQNNYIEEGDEIINYNFYRNPFHRFPKEEVKEFEIEGRIWRQHTLYISAFEKLLYRRKIHFFNTPFKKTIRKVKLVAALNGGDGLTDLYGDILLNSRLPEINLAIELNIPFIIMPQTIGPFLNEVNKDRIITLLKRADRIYVRDDNFIDELKKHNLTYVKTKDLSYFMNPQPFEIEIKKPCVGINVSGLAYSNKFGNLAGQFDNYPKIITELIKRFQERNYNIYIIPHSYNVNKPEVNNDDMESSKLFYDSLYNKKGVYFVERDLISPQLKYLISQMDFFVGTRMHANFAAIFTNTPAFGLAYSYKFKSAFENNGIFNRTIDINNVSSCDVNKIVETIENAFVEDVLKKKS